MARPVELIYEFIRQSELLPRNRFIDFVGGPVLLFKRWSISKPILDLTKTTRMEQPLGALADLLEDQKKQLVTEAHDYRVYRLIGEEWVLGRSSSSDLVFAHRSVSKAHARLALGADQSLMVTDLGSKNGTWVESKHALADKPLVLWSKQQLRLGTLGIRYLSAGDFFDLLGSLVTQKAG